MDKLSVVTTGIFINWGRWPFGLLKGKPDLAALSGDLSKGISGLNKAGSNGLCQ